MPQINSKRRPWQAPRRAQTGRKVSTMFYTSKEWRSVRSVKLKLNILCENCEQHNRTALATMVDHIIPIRLGGDALELDNLQSLCTRCHNRKSGQERHDKRYNK